MPITDPVTIQMKRELYDNIKKLADEVAAELQLSKLSQAEMVNMMYLDYMTRRKTRLKGQRNGK